MARKPLTAEQIHQKAIEVRQAAEEKLRGIAGRGGIERDFERATNMYEKRNNPGVRTEQVIEDYKRTKAAYEKVAEEYTKAQAAEEKAKAAVDTAATEATNQSKIDDAQKAIDEALAAKRKADLLAPSRGQASVDAAAKAVTDAQSAYNKVKNPQSTNVDGTSAEGAVDFSSYALASNGVTDSAGNQVVFVTSKDGTGKVIQKTFSKTNGGMNAAVIEFMKNYSTAEGQRLLQDSLIAKNYIKESQVKDGTWTLGVADLLLKYSAKYLTDGKFTPGAIAITPSEYLNTMPGLGGKTPTQFRTITTRGDAKKELDSYMVDLLGRVSTPAEDDAYYAKLHAAEQKAVRTTSGGTTTGSTLDATDHLLLIADVAKVSLKGTNVEKLVTSGGRAATDIASLQAYASAYGVQMSAVDALKYVAAGIGQQDYIAKQKERIRQTSIVLHPNLREHILAGGTVADIAEQYAYTKRQKLGVAIPVSTSDKDVMDAVAKGMSVSDFNRQMQADPLWRKTEEAQNVAADFASTILQSFGFGG